jgi:outer membrane protein assembly factor BamE
VAACFALSSCFLKPHRIDVQQGNYLDTEAIAKLKPGMTRSQVRFLLGTPLLTDAFHPDRWDYLYIDRKKGKVVQEHRLTLWFEGDQLKRAVTDTVAPKTAGAAPAAQGKQSGAAPVTQGKQSGAAPATQGKQSAVGTP